MILRTLGVAGSAPRPDSPASTYLVQVPADAVAAGIASGVVPDDVEVRDWNVVVDLGSGGLGYLQRHVSLHALDAVALSHLHPDHCADLSGLYVHLKYHPELGFARTGVPPHLPVYGPIDVAQRAAAMYGLHPGETMDQIYDFRNWYDGVTVRVGPLEITPRAVYHPVEAYGLRIVGPSTTRPGAAAVLAYTGDTDYCAAVVEVAQDADVLLAEAAFVQGRDDRVEPGIHLTGARAGRVAAEASVRRLVLTHLPSWTDPQVVFAEARTEYDGPATLAVPDGVEEI
ncbi:Metal-dependent hydrolase of the beta-lactamase superfamily III [Xylanimonas cellulosilytica DSM 15894]|uniref:Metal-dependent hydrolase of the beta-lactamase superfamily III n=1 Tax=Xylanimonas cellulosilytica (strain DSM 15894 / JCM 12276 / CECT 5975 / KCTC 9989 / LMG 20990 / NBRC 107835 / XIL07) TaxID=446471 RepID=D1BZD6_XYLCX|nr:MBL fold metallo-hydrolase [Xylanimonas cellulosilytica]ACZ30090.1 Metal-dependent hydrolase of the beta-lactamase superfamily III [Xylanimonas cellulosilytica DSM 15894]